MKTFVSCPTCSAQIEWSASNPSRPFCSERCKLIDLGAWVEGEHRIASEESPFSEDITGEIVHSQRSPLK